MAENQKVIERNSKHIRQSLSQPDFKNIFSTFDENTDNDNHEEYEIVQNNLQNRNEYNIGNNINNNTGNTVISD